MSVTEFFREKIADWRADRAIRQAPVPGKHELQRRASSDYWMRVGRNQDGQRGPRRPGNISGSLRP